VFAIHNAIAHLPDLIPHREPHLLVASRGGHDLRAGNSRQHKRLWRGRRGGRSRRALGHEDVDRVQIGEHRPDADDGIVAREVAQIVQVDANIADEFLVERPMPLQPGHIVHGMRPMHPRDRVVAPDVENVAIAVEPENMVPNPAENLVLEVDFAREPAHASQYLVGRRGEGELVVGNVHENHLGPCRRSLKNGRLKLVRQVGKGRPDTYPGRAT
jgi:hypothetical protein